MINRMTFLILGLCIFQFTHGQDEIRYSELITEGNKLYNEQQFEKSWQKYDSALLVKSNEPDDLYNGACVAALSGRKEKAFELLNKSVDKGFLDNKHLEKDCDLQSLRSSREWLDLLSKMAMRQLKQKSKEQQFDDIFIHDSIPDYMTESLKTELIKKAGIIKKLFELHKIKGFEELQESSSTISNISIFSGGTPQETIISSYTLTPDYYGFYSNKILIKPYGYKISIKHSKQKNQLQITGLDIDSCYLKSNTNIYKSFNDFISNIDSCKVQFGIIKEDKSIQMYTLGFDRNQILVILKDVQYKNMEEFNYLQSSGICYISFYKKGTERQSYFETSSKIETFEMVFSLDNENLVLISNGNNFAFYQIPKINKLRALLTNEIKKINN